MSQLSKKKLLHDILATAWLRWVFPFLFVGVANWCLSEESAGPVLIMNQGSYLGVVDTEKAVEAYFGIPFAAPPIKDGRWRSPMAVEKKPGTLRAATEFAPACYQGEHITHWYRDMIVAFGGDPEVFVAPRVSEDCLYLNIWRPRESQKPLPVIVYVHGGSNKGGWSYEPNYIGEALAAKNVVVISVAYRLGVFGFFQHPALSNTNFGLEDIVAALRWVQSNSISLNIDPMRVTVMGESAGANNIAHLVTMDDTESLFQRLIHQSAGWAVNETPSSVQSVKLAERLAEHFSASSLSALRSVPVDELNAVAEGLFANEGFYPQVDKETVNRSLKATIEAADLRGIDLLIGTNRHEELLYLDPQSSWEVWLQSHWPSLTTELVRAAFPLLPYVETEREQLNELASALDWACPSITMAEKNQLAGGRSWVYWFSRVRDGGFAEQLGAYHGAELPYVFGTHDSWLPTQDVDEKLSQQMMQYWVNFAATGDPNGYGVPEWPIFSKTNKQAMVFENLSLARKHPNAEFCDRVDLL